MTHGQQHHIVFDQIFDQIIVFDQIFDQRTVHIMHIITMTCIRLRSTHTARRNRNYRSTHTARRIPSENDAPQQHHIVFAQRTVLLNAYHACVRLLLHAYAYCSRRNAYHALTRHYELSPLLLQTERHQCLSSSER